MSNDTTLLFGLEGVEVVSVELDHEANPLLTSLAISAKPCLAWSW